MELVELVVAEMWLEEKIGDAQADTQTRVFQEGRQCSLSFPPRNARRSNPICQPTHYLMGHGE